LSLPCSLSFENSCRIGSAAGSQGANFPIAEQWVSAISNEPVNSEYHHLVVTGLQGGLTGKPGQFFHLLCPQSEHDSPYLRRPMSIYSTNPEIGGVEFLYKVTGAGTRGLATLKSGDRLNILGPLGAGFALNGGWRTIVVLGRGVGLATLAPLAAMAQQQGISVLAILSARSPEVLMSVDVFERHGATVVTVTDTDGTSGTRNVERLIRKFATEGKIDAFFTCGSRRLTALLQKLGREFDIPGQVALEQQMACGLGMCFCCVKSFRIEGGTKQRRVCVEGPVFDLAEVLP